MCQTPHIPLLLVILQPSQRRFHMEFSHKSFCFMNRDPVRGNSLNFSIFWIHTKRLCCLSPKKAGPNIFSLGKPKRVKHNPINNKKKSRVKMINFFNISRKLLFYYHFLRKNKAKTRKKKKRKKSSSFMF